MDATKTIERKKSILPAMTAEPSSLVCPAEFDTGAAKNGMIVSVPEGQEKPMPGDFLRSARHRCIFYGCVVGDWSASGAARQRSSVGSSVCRYART